MKRSPELTPLSHDHHRALFVALGLKRADDPSAGASFAEFMDTAGEEHFRTEESLLLPWWIAHDPTADVGLANRVITEHLELRAAGCALRIGEPSIKGLHELGEKLEGHVRFEERELFPRIERGLDADSLRGLATQMALREQA